MRHLFIILASLLSSIALAQQVNYTIEEDKPELHPRLSLNMDLAQLDFNRMLDASSFNFGLWGYYEVLNSKLFVEANAKKSWFALGKLGNKYFPGNFELNIGANYMLINNTKSKNIKVVLDAKHSENRYTNSTTTTITYIKVPAHIFTSTGVRGGMYYKANPYIFDEDNGFLAREYGGKMASTGGYVGLIHKRAKTVVIKDPQFGRSFASVGYDFYFDALILPSNIFMDNYTNDSEVRVDETKAITDMLGKSPFGARFGFKIYQVAKRKYTGKRFGLSASFEAGVKPYLGWFFNGGIGITILK